MAIRKLPSTGDAPRSTGVPESLVPGGAADSAGFPWDGRTFDHHGTAFSDDDGATPAAWGAAVAGVRRAAARLTAGEPGADLDALAGAHADAIVALSGVRLLIPLLAEAGETGLTPDGRTVEKSQELSIVTVAAPDGRRVMPVFSSVEAMRHWHAEARPIPVPGPQVALAAAQEETDLIIIDPGSPAQEFGVRRTQLQAAALGERCVPAWADPRVLEAFRASMAGEPRVAELLLVPGDPEARLLAAETDVVLRLAPGLAREELRQIVADAQQRWAADAIIAERVDSLRVRPVAA
ncbi:SseB family protein [Leucobacter chironomi]|uniref:SseB family protein n=1 Tax=Leucobacter chironomi TaxID=491918 RepID=UPI0004295142|nr:SseB family protein [Leucobacter chironomi]